MRRGGIIAAGVAGTMALGLSAVLVAVAHDLLVARAAAEVLVVSVAAPLVVVGLPRGPCARLEARGGSPFATLRAWAHPAVALPVLGSVLVVSWTPGLTDPPGQAPALDAAVFVGLALASLAVWVAPLGPWATLRPGVPARITSLLVLALLPLVGALAVAAWSSSPGGAIGASELSPSEDRERAVVVLVLGGAVPALAAVAVLVGWARSGDLAAAKPVVLSGRDELTSADVERELRRLGPAREREPPA